MNVYKIWQVREEHIREYGFRALDALVRDGLARAAEGVGPYGLPREAWEQIYLYVTEKEPSLDWLFCLFNDFDGEIRPEDFHGHSMSVSDIVETPDGRLWFCDSLGWKEVQWTKEDP